MNIAVVGTGIIGASHLQAIEQSKHFTLCAVCDINIEAAESYAQKYGVPYFSNYQDIPYKTNAEAVILNLPHWLHCEASIFFLERGIHVLVEKPMANTKAECDRMIDAAVRSGKKLAVGHLQRFFQANRYVKKLVQNMVLGDLCMITEYRSIDYFLPSRPKWFLDKAMSGGGIVMNYGAHALDKVFYITDSRPVSIHALCGNISNNASIEGHAQILVKLANNVPVSITFSGYANTGYETVYYFTKGALKVVGGRTLYKNSGKNWEEIPFSEPDNQLLHQLDAFYQLITGEPSELPSLDYCADIIATIEKIYEQG